MTFEFKKASLCGTHLAHSSVIFTQSCMMIPKTSVIYFALSMLQLSQVFLHFHFQPYNVPSKEMMKYFQAVTEKSFQTSQAFMGRQIKSLATFC